MAATESVTVTVTVMVKSLVVLVPGLVAEDSRSKGCGFKSRRRRYTGSKIDAILKQKWKKIWRNGQKVSTIFK